MNKFKIAIATVMLAISGCSPDNPISEASLSSQQQESVKNALKEHKVKLISISKSGLPMSPRGDLNVSIEAENGLIEFVDRGLSAIENGDCDVNSMYKVLRELRISVDERNKSGIKFETNIDKRCINSEALTNYLLHVIDREAFAYKHEVLIRDLPELNKSSYANKESK